MTFTYVPDLVCRPTAARRAVASWDGELTYDELWDRVAATGAVLRDAGAVPGDRVGLAFHRGVDYVPSLLATMTIGAVAVPIDPELPGGRIVRILDAAGPRVVLHAGAIPARDGRWLDVHAFAGTGGGGWSWRERPAAEQPAVILFTSGSTGEPKGVCLHHAGLVNRLRWGHRYFGFDASDRGLHKASIVFDASIHEILAPLIAGGTLVIAAPGLQFDSLGLVRLMRQTGVTSAHFVPTMLRHVLDEAEFAGCTDLRRVLCGGEALDMSLVRRLRALLPAALYNGYGPTETSVNVTYWDAAEPYDGDIAPLGRPIDGVHAYVLDDDRHPVAPGEAGELWIGGVAVGLGYLDDEAHTQQRFRPDPFAGGRMYRTGDRVRQAPAGYLEFGGRIDDQVKVRGVRVEPDEVSLVLRRHPKVHDAVVIAVGQPGQARLIGYVAARRQCSPIVDGLRRVPLPSGLAVAAPSGEEALFLHRQIFDASEYGRFGIRVPDGAVVVDVGANIGLFSLWASRQARDVRIVAVEPNPDVLPYLRVNLDLYCRGADLVEAAATDRAGTAQLTSFPELTYLSGLGERESAAADLLRSHYAQVASPATDGAAPSAAEARALLTEARRRLHPTVHVVPTVTLGDLVDRLALDRIDLLKINAEGAELGILRGVRPEQWPRVGQVCLEVERSTVVAPQARALLVDAGFTVHDVRDWSVGPDADVSYLYATRATPPGPRAPDQHPAPATQTVLGPGELREYLSGEIPATMQPEQLVFLERLPRLPNGKLSRRDLPPPAPPVEAGSADAGDRAGRLRDLWRSALGVAAVHDEDNFIALGGHSLTALRVSTRVRQLLGLEISPATCLRARTFAQWLDLLAAPPALDRGVR